jgi:hypothetical protein
MAKQIARGWPGLAVQRLSVLKDFEEALPKEINE